jgi:hypothetical protein
MTESTVRDRFATKHVVNESTGCWDWTASKDPCGYGKIRVGNGMVGAHRVSYEIHVGPIPDGLTIDHLCRNRACVNPQHLEPVPHRENVLRSDNPPAQQARMTHCYKGHEFTAANTYRRGDRRQCRQCKRDYMSAYTRPSRRREH